MPWMVLNCSVPTEVSEEDFGLLSGFNFTLNDWGYLFCSNGPFRGKCLHIIVAERCNLDTSNKIDHEDRNRLNNKRDNLRPATNSQNRMNGCLRFDNTSKVSGVYFREDTQKWRAEIKLNWKNISLGSFINKEDAVCARKQAEIKYFGEFKPERGDL